MRMLMSGPTLPLTMAVTRPTIRRIRPLTSPQYKQQTERRRSNSVLLKVARYSIGPSMMSKVTRTRFKTMDTLQQAKTNGSQRVPTIYNTSLTIISITNNNSKCQQCHHHRHLRRLHHRHQKWSLTLSQISVTIRSIENRQSYCHISHINLQS